MNKNIFNHMIQLRKTQSTNTKDNINIINGALNDFDLSQDTFESKDDFISIYVSYFNCLLLTRNQVSNFQKKQVSSESYSKNNNTTNTNTNINNEETLKALTAGFGSLLSLFTGPAIAKATTIGLASAIGTSLLLANSNEKKTDNKRQTGVSKTKSTIKEKQEIYNILEEKSHDSLILVYRDFCPNINKFDLDDVTKEYLNLIVSGIIENNVERFKEANKLNSDYSMANLYLFMHYFNEMSYSTDQKEVYTNYMTKYWNKLSRNWKEYVLSNDSYILSQEEKLSMSNLNEICYIPYISYEFLEKPIRERIIENILCICEKLISCINHNNTEFIDTFKSKISENKELNDKEQEFYYEFKKMEYYWLQLSEYDLVNNKSLLGENETESDIIIALSSIIFPEIDNSNSLNTSNQQAMNINFFHKDFIPMLKKYYKKNRCLPAVFGSTQNEVLKQVLQIPSYSNIRQLDIKNAITLSNKAREFEKLNEELQLQKKSKSKLLDDNVHTWKHIAFNDITIKLAKELSERDENDKIAMQLFDVNTSQTLLLVSLKVLGEEFGYSNNEEYQKKFKFSMCSSKYSTAVSVKEVLSLALKTSLSKIFYEDSCSEGENIFNKKNRNRLKDSYLKNISFAENKIIFDSLGWFSENIYNINIINLDSWSSIYFKEDELSYFKFTEIFLNLINNVINYGVKNDSGYIDIEFDKRIVNEVEFYVLKMRNPIEKSTAFLGSQKKGIDTIKSNIEKINNDTSYEYVIVNENKNIFEIEILINSKKFGK